MSPPRFGIYYVPTADTNIYRFGAAALGYDCYTGETVPYLDLAPEDWAELTREPRIYGFHATLKAPFRLIAGVTERDLAHELRRFAGMLRPAPAFTTDIVALGGFVAIVPRDFQDAVHRIAAECVTHFDGFRAPLTAEELRRRRESGLSERQDECLQRWGYPYVLDDFQFHMTLTGRLDAGRRPGIIRFLQSEFVQQCGSSKVTLDRLVLVRQDAAGPFFVVAQAAIGRNR